MLLLDGVNKFLLFPSIKCITMFVLYELWNWNEQGNDLGLACILLYSSVNSHLGNFYKDFGREGSWMEMF